MTAYCPSRIKKEKLDNEVRGEQLCWFHGIQIHLLRFRVMENRVRYRHSVPVAPSQGLGLV